VWTGSEFGLSWRGYQQISLLRLDASGSVVGEAVKLTDNDSPPDLVWNGEGFGLAWESGNRSYLTGIGCDCPDSDGDGLNVCAGDNCPAVYNPSQNDADDDAVGDVCDNCVTELNPTQNDADGDAGGDACDNCPMHANTGQSDADGDLQGDPCDNCPAVPNPDQEDPDGDGYGSACDNCALDRNPTQTDMDDDSEGDACDLDDGVIYVWSGSANRVEWQEETGFNTWNLYKGDLEVLRTEGVYTQDPDSVPLARADCRLHDPWATDTEPPLPGQVATFLVTGNAGGLEADLGSDSSGAPRPNDHPCP
jgi:hypothetical protein